MIGIVLIVLFWTHGAVLTGMVIRDHPWSRDRLFYMLGFGTSMLLTGLGGAGAMGMGVATGNPIGGIGGVLAAAFVCMVGMILHAPFLARGGTELLDYLRESAMSDGNVTVAKTYDKAEAAEKRHDWRAAVALYDAEIAADPFDTEARSRVAEVRLKMGQPEAAKQVLAEAYEVAEDPEEKGPLGFRLSEVQLQSGETQAASATLERVRADLVGTRFEGYARQRLSGLGATNGATP